MSASMYARRSGSYNVAISAALPLETSANCLSQNTAMGTLTFFTVLPGFSCSNFSLSSIRTGALLGSVHMKLGQRMSAARSTVGMQSNTAKLNDLATFLFIVASSLE